MEESTVLKKSDTVSSATFIESAVVSSVRRDLFRDKLKRRSNARLFARCFLLRFVRFSF